jgi:hypothetical protein
MNTLHTLRPCLLLSALAFASLAGSGQVWAASAENSADASLERLFHTRQQRSILDELRRRNAHISGEQESDSIALQGIVRRSGGHSTVWINGRAHHDHAPVAAVGTRSAQVFVGDGKTRELKVGERLTLTPPGATQP